MGPPPALRQLPRMASAITEGSAEPVVTDKVFMPVTESVASFEGCFGVILHTRLA